MTPTTVGYAVLAVGVLLALLLVARDRRGALLGVLLALGAVVLALRWSPPRELHRAVPQRDPGSAYVGSSACVSCHEAEHASWWRTYHRSMTRVADEQSVAPRLPVHLELDGRSYDLERTADGAFFVTGPDLHQWGTFLAQIRQLSSASGDEARALAERAARHVPRVRRELVLVTGSHHYQAFWVEGGEGRELRQLPFVYLLDESLAEAERWLARRDAFLQPPDALPHVARWNANCIQCHSVAGQPGHSEESSDSHPFGRYDSSVADYGIGCEACHGPGAAHVKRYQDPLARQRAGRSARDIVQPARLDAPHASAVCGQCHSYFVPTEPDQWWESGFTESFRPGDTLGGGRLVLDYERDREEPDLLSRGLDSVFWPDGTIRVGGREYNGLVRSPCFERGSGSRQMSCLSCHSLHESDPEDQLAEGMTGNRACTQCHTELAERIEEHTRHPAESSGSLCYNCHMPRTTYALLKAIRSHRITSPHVDRAEDAAPNACNLCHLDRPLDWTEHWLRRWSEPRKPGSDAPPPSAASAREEPPASVSWLLAGNAAQRILLADGMAWPPALEASGTGWQRPLLERLLDDPYAAVRHVARRSLRRLEELPRQPAPSGATGWAPEVLDELAARRNDAPITISE